MTTSTRRPVRDALAGLAASVVLLVLIVGVPVALITVFGLPIPHGLPSASAFTHRLQASSVLAACSVVVWLAWLQFLWCVAAEVSAAVRNTGMPARVPLAGGIQPLVHRLVGAALLLSAATALAPALAPVAASAATVPAGVTASASGDQTHGTAQLTAAPANGTAHPAAALPAAFRAGADGRGGNGTTPENISLDAVTGDWAQHSEKVYVVRPPAGRFHESLWEIAQNHLGDGRRYREIFEMNSGRVQPDGSKLTIASLIRPGWVLRMPHDAHGQGIEIMKAKAPPKHQRPPAAKHVTPPATPPRPATPGPSMPGGATTPRQHKAAPSAPESARPRHGSPTRITAPSTSPAYPVELTSAALLAVGVLAGLERRRRRQARHRPAGRKVAPPPPAAAWAELALLLGEDEAAAQMLDSGLRYLCHALECQGRTPPTVFAVHVGEENLDLWVSPASQDAPAPWYAVGDGQVWRLALVDAPRLDLGQVSVPAPYPGLVSVGTDATGRVLVDLEAARGLIAITGPGDVVADAMAAMATELATSFWSDSMHLTLVGTGGDLEILAPDRVHIADTLDEALRGLEAHAMAVSGALAVRGAAADGPGPEAVEPHYLITLQPPSERERERLLVLTRTPATGFLIAGETPGAAWTWDVTSDGRLRAPQLGLDVEAQLISREHQAAIAELFESADDLEGAVMAAPLVEAAPDEHLVPDTAAQVEVTLLGPVAITATGQIEPDRLPLATEVVAYLATHPGGVHPNVLMAAIWPRGVTDEVRDATLARVQAWLGSDGIGRPHLAADASGRLRLGSGVRVDWHVFLTLVAQAEQAAGGAREETRLALALDLVRGPFLAGRERGRYTWLVTDGLDYEAVARVGDAAHRLAELRMAGDPRGAMDAARAGLRLAPDDEILWRDLLTAGHASGDEDLLRGAASEVWARAAQDGAPPAMTAETEALMDELMPTWRWTLS